MLNLNEVKRLLKTRNLSAVSKATGLEYWKVRKVFRDVNPRYLWVEKIANHLEEETCKTNK